MFFNYTAGSVYTKTLQETTREKTCSFVAKITGLCIYILITLVPQKYFFNLAVRVLEMLPLLNVRKSYIKDPTLTVTIAKILAMCNLLKFFLKCRITVHCEA